jgi:hypothetical protein
MRPMRKMPPEILGEIFLFCVSGTLVIPSEELDTLWSVTQTCSEWRNVAVGMPHLWNDLKLILANGSSSNRETISFTLRCLNNCLNSSISIDIMESSFGSPPGSIAHLVPHASRIHKLSIHLFWFDLAALVIPMLQDLEITSRNSPIDGLARLIERSRCSITQLVVNVSSGDQFLEYTPSLKELVFVGGGTFSLNTMPGVNVNLMYHDISMPCTYIEAVIYQCVSLAIGLIY